MEQIRERKMNTKQYVFRFIRVTGICNTNGSFV